MSRTHTRPFILLALAAVAAVPSCSSTLALSAAPLRAGDATVGVQHITFPATMSEGTYDDGKSLVQESEARVSVQVRNESGDKSLDFQATQLALLWDGDGCRAKSFRDKDGNKLHAVLLGPKQSREVTFICHRFPVFRERTLEGEAEDEDRRYVSTSGTPAISLGVWAKGHEQPKRLQLLPGDELHLTVEPITYPYPPRSYAVGVAVGAAPSLALAGYRSFGGADLAWMIGRLELSFAVQAFTGASITLTHQGARTIALTPGLGARLPWKNGQVQMRGGWTWAPRFEQDASATGPNLRLGVLLWGLKTKTTVRSASGETKSVADAEQILLAVAWTRLFAYGGPADLKDAHMLMVSVGAETIWAPPPSD